MTSASQGPADARSDSISNALRHLLDSWRERYARGEWPEPFSADANKASAQKGLEQCTLDIENLLALPAQSIESWGREIQRVVETWRANAAAYKEIDLYGRAYDFPGERDTMGIMKGSAFTLERCAADLSKLQQAQDAIKAAKTAEAAALSEQQRAERAARKAQREAFLAEHPEVRAEERQRLRKSAIIAVAVAFAIAAIILTVAAVRLHAR